MRNLKHPLKDIVVELRKVISNAHKGITEHIKWNAPSFCSNGEDRITFNFGGKDHVRLIFHRGSKVKSSKDFLFNDVSGLIEWIAPDRGIVKFYDINEVKEKNKLFKKLVNDWFVYTS